MKIILAQSNIFNKACEALKIPGIKIDLRIWKNKTLENSMFYKGLRVEAWTGIEPVYTDLQSAASPLRHQASLSGGEPRKSHGVLSLSPVSVNK